MTPKQVQMAATDSRLVQGVLNDLTLFNLGSPAAYEAALKLRDHLEAIVISAGRMDLLEGGPEEVTPPVKKD